MVCVEWNNSLSIGIPETDNEHMRLVAIFNELDEAMRRGKGSRVMMDILDQLIQYTVTHFQSEEALMEQFEYPKTELHKVQHQQLVDKVSRYRRKFISRRERITREMMEFLKYWLTNHILVDDMEFGKFVTSGAIPKETQTS